MDIFLRSEVRENPLPMVKIVNEQSNSIEGLWQQRNNRSGRHPLEITKGKTAINLEKHPQKTMQCYMHSNTKKTTERGQSPDLFFNFWKGFALTTHTTGWKMKRIIKLKLDFLDIPQSLKKFEAWIQISCYPKSSLRASQNAHFVT